MDKKSLSSRQVWWIQELFWCHFQIDYCQGKANAAVDALLKFFQKSQNKKNELQAENGRIFHHLQNSLTNASLAGLSFSSFFPSHLHKVLICGIYVLPQLWQFWNSLQKELAQEKPYVVGDMKLQIVGQGEASLKAEGWSAAWLAGLERHQ